MGKVTKSIEIEASPEKVWAFVTDNKKLNDASKGLIEIEPTSKGPLAVGQTAHFVGEAGGHTQEMDIECTEFVKNKKYAFRTIGASKNKAEMSFTLEPTAKGTKLTVNNEYEVPYSILGKIVDKLKVRADIEKGMTKILENIKKAI